MRSILASLAALALLAVLPAACGGDAAPPPATPAPTATAPEPAPSASAAPSAQSKADAPPAPPSIESQRAPFIAKCTQKIDSPEYCTCGFEQFKAVFEGSDLSQVPPPEKIALLKSKTIQACGSKLPEDVVKTGFLTSCSGGDTHKDAYCGCAWSALRKKLDVADFIGDFEGPRFDEAKKSMVGVCKGKLPEASAKADFMGGCTRQDPGRSAACECAWKKVRAKHTPEEIAANVVDIKAVPGLDKCQQGKKK